MPASETVGDLVFIIRAENGRFREQIKVAEQMTQGSVAQMVGQFNRLSEAPKRAAVSFQMLNTDLRIMSRIGHLLPGELGNLASALTNVGYSARIAAYGLTGVKATMVGVGAAILGIIVYRNEIADAFEGLLKWADLLDHTASELRAVEAEQDRWNSRVRETNVLLDVARGRISAEEAEVRKLRAAFPETPIEAIAADVADRATAERENREKATAERIAQKRAEAAHQQDQINKALGKELMILAGIAKETDFIYDVKQKTFVLEIERIKAQQRMAEEELRVPQTAIGAFMAAHDALARIRAEERTRSLMDQQIGEWERRGAITVKEAETLRAGAGIREVKEPEAVTKRTDPAFGGRSSLTPVTAFTNMAALAGTLGVSEERRFRQEHLATLKKIEANTRQTGLAA